MATPPCGEQHDGQLAELRDLLDQLVGGAEVLGGGVQLVVVEAAQPGDLVLDLTQVADGLDDVAGTGLALRADHGRALGDAAQGLAQVGGAADEGGGERELVAVVDLVGRGEDLGLVDVVDTEGLEHLGLDEVADAGLGHDGDGDGPDDLLDHVGVGHPGHAAVLADVGRDPLQGHDGHGARVLGDLRLFGVDDVHDHAALELLGHAALDAGGAGGGVLGGLRGAGKRGHGTSLGERRWMLQRRANAPGPVHSKGQWTGRGSFWPSPDPSPDLWPET
ncbi:hypothetical protein SPW_6547 [Streptomyces sp. W007]|nr:hypothetical protein SPW_6547 [Streptomyces sp. W007]